MKLHWTRSKDGTHRVNIQVTHRLSEDDLVAVLASWALAYGTEPLSQARLMETIRQTLVNVGSNALMQDKEVDDESWREVYSWAEEAVNRLSGRPIKGWEL